MVTGLRARFSPIHSRYTWMHPHSILQHLIKFVDDTTIAGFIPDNKEPSDRKEAQHLLGWCSESNLVQNTIKTNKIILDFRRPKRTISPPLQRNTEEVNLAKPSQIPGCPHNHRAHIVSKHTWRREPAKSFICQETEVSWNILPAAPKLLQEHNREHYLRGMSVWYGSSLVEDRKDLTGW